MGNANKKVLIADSQSSSVVGLKNGLTEAGYEVYYAEDGNKALELVNQKHPHIILSDVNLPQLDGHRLLKLLRANADTRTIPFIFLSAQKHVDERIKSISMGVDDYIVKPYYLDEVLARIEMLLNEVENSEANLKHGKDGFFGNLSEMNLVDLIQTLEVGKKSAILRLKRNGIEGQVSIQSGEVINAALDKYQPEQALAKMFTWTEGQFYVDLREVNSPKVISSDNKQIVAEGMKKVSQWQQIKAQLPPLNSILTIKPELTENDLKEFNVDEKEIIEMSKGDKPIWDLIEESRLDDIHALEIVKRMYLKGVLRESSVAGQSGKLISTSLEKMKSKNENLKSNLERMLSIIASFFRRPTKQQNLVEDDSQQHEHQQAGDSPEDEHRKNWVVKTNRQVYLTKGELMMIREKLM